MAEETKNPEVELDTDGVNEERVDIPEAKEPDESFAQKEDVDLGYTDIKGEDNVTGEKTKGGILLSDTTQETIQMTTVCGLVLKMGDLCYQDNDKFPKGPWCKLNDWVIFSRYAGSRFKIEGGEVRVLNDDEVIAKINDPSDILHHY